MLALALLASVAIMQEEAPRLRTLLPNGPVILVERMPQAKSVSVQLFASARGARDTKETHGYRHLLEHLVLKGKDRKLDLRMESAGVLFTGQTHRDAMQIAFECAPESLPVALSALGEILQPLQTSEEEIAREAKIIAEEMALMPDSMKLSIAGWRSGYSERGLDPIGSLESLGTARPDDLVDLQRRHFSGQNLALVIVGPVSLNETTRMARDLLKDTEKGDKVEPSARGAGTPGREEIDGAFGEARGALVPGFTEPQTAWALCAALALAARLEGAFMTYTPTVDHGLIFVGRTTARSGVGLLIEDLDEADEAQLFTIGKGLGRRWVEHQLSTPAGAAFLRGMLLSQSSGARPETMLEHIEAMGWPEFRSGIARFRKEQAVVSVETGR
jgi:predicted Zn-dependent peptidase